MIRRTLLTITIVSLSQLVLRGTANAAQLSCAELRNQIANLERDAKASTNTPTIRKLKRSLLEVRMELARYCPTVKKTSIGHRAAGASLRSFRPAPPIAPEQAIRDAEGQLDEIRAERKKCPGDRAAECSLPLDNEMAEVSVLLLRALTWKGDPASLERVANFVKGGEFMGSAALGTRFLKAVQTDGGKDLQDIVVAATSRLQQRTSRDIVGLINLDLSLADIEFSAVWQGYLKQRENDLSDAVRTQLRQAGNDTDKIAPIVSSVAGSDARVFLDVAEATRVARRKTAATRSQNVGTLFVIIAKGDPAACPASNDFINALTELMTPDPERGIPSPVFVEGASLADALDVAACCGRRLEDCRKDVKPGVLDQLRTARDVQCDGALGVTLLAGAAEGMLRISQPTGGELGTNFRQIPISRVEFECMSGQTSAIAAALDFHNKLLDRLTAVSTGPVAFTMRPPETTVRKVSAWRAAWLSGMPEISDALPGNNLRGWTLAGIDTALVVGGITTIGFSIAERNRVSNGDGSISRANTLLAVGGGLLLSAALERLLSGLYYAFE